jgi:diadenosine tetraphosphate (Ap4A) HIT family hydrolase
MKTEHSPLCRSNGALKTRVLFASGDVYLTESFSNQGNYLIVPEDHAERLDDLPDTWWRDAKAALRHVASLEGNYNLSINVGKQAGQTVKHLLFWEIPRAAGQPASGKGLARLIDEANVAV